MRLTWLQALQLSNRPPYHWYRALVGMPYYFLAIMIAVTVSTSPIDFFIYLLSGIALANAFFAFAFSKNFLSMKKLRGGGVYFLTGITLCGAAAFLTLK